MIRDVGLNPTRLRFLEVLGRMGVELEVEVERRSWESRSGPARAAGGGARGRSRVDADELPLVIDEVPVLAVLAAHARGDSWFAGARELRVKESDRLRRSSEGIRASGVTPPTRGTTSCRRRRAVRRDAPDRAGDHRIAMALAVAALAAPAPSEIDGMEAAAVSFPGFVATLARARAPTRGDRVRRPRGGGHRRRRRQRQETLARLLARDARAPVREHGVDVPGAPRRRDPTGVDVEDGDALVELHADA